MTRIFSSLSPLLYYCTINTQTRLANKRETPNSNSSHKISKMRAAADHHHGIGSVSCLYLLLSMAVQLVGAQSPTQTNNGNPYPYTTFSPSMAIIIVVLIAALFFMGFCSIYIRHCSDGSVSVGSIRRALSIRSRRAAAARGLDPSVIETFPTFTYSDVKDHKIGKGALECAVCLNEFAEDETLRLLPKCDHVFHPECIDAWLESHVTCPVCRANLTPQGAEETAEQAPGESTENDAEERARNVEIAIDVDDGQQQGVGEAADPANQSQGLEYPARPPRAWSVRRPKMFGLGKFRSHSTGHSLVVPGENLDRFTLRLPEVKRKEVMDRAMLNRTRSCAPRVAIEHGSSRGYRAAAGEGSSRTGRFNWRFERSERAAKSDRWGIFTRGMSMKSTKVVADGGDGSGSSRAPVRMPSLKCLEPKTVDEAGLISGDPTRSQV